jgi:hypothetical protein
MFSRIIALIGVATVLLSESVDKGMANIWNRQTFAGIFFQKKSPFFKAV